MTAAGVVAGTGSPSSAAAWPAARIHTATARIRTLILALAALLALASPARADRGFAPRFSANAGGDIAVLGNTLETCPSPAPGCDAARAGQGPVLNNNGFAMERVDIDSDRATFDSSSAELRLPEGARVLFAGLYFGARTNAGTRGKAAPNAAPAALRTVALKPPGRSAYERLSGELDESTEVKGAYGAFANVTAEVQRAGSGEYTVADVQSATGQDRYAGWALIVAYEAAADPPRNLTVFDGLRSVTQGKPALTIPVSGFQTPLSGAVRTKLGFVAYEGDLGLNGDGAALDGTPLADAVNPAKNFFNSGISIDGSRFTSKAPDYVNQFGFDAKLNRIDGSLANGATAASIALKTASDQYLPQVITFATDLYAPVIRAAKTVTDLTHHGGPTRPGDMLRYTVTYRNHGVEPARDFVAADELPPGITYLPGSLRIPTAAGQDANPSDVSGDDLGEYDAARRAVRFFLGAGATRSSGGTLSIGGQPGDEATVSFEARIDPEITNELEITDVAQATFQAPNLGTQLSAVSSPASVTVTPVAKPSPSAITDLVVEPTETVVPDGGGDKVLDQIVIENHGPSDATHVHLRKQPPPGVVIESATASVGSCELGGGTLSCTVPHIDSGGAVVIEVVEQEPAAAAAAGSLDKVTVVGDQFDPTPQNNSADATAPAPGPPGAAQPRADVAVALHAGASTVRLGESLVETVTVRNDGPSLATGVSVADMLDAAVQLEQLTAGGASCTRRVLVRCTFPSLPAHSSRTIVLKLRPLAPGPLSDAAAVRANELDPRYANNIARSTAQVRIARAIARLRLAATANSPAPGARVGIVLFASTVTPTPGLAPVLCAAIPRGLRLIDAPGAVRRASSVCWFLRELIVGRPQTFHLQVQVARTASPGASARVRAVLSGGNFASRTQAAALVVPPRAVACPAGAGPPRARIAC